jgi:hypothetical protein
MAGIIAVFAPELVILSVALLAVVVFLLLHIRSFVRNTFGAAALLFSWAMQAGFVGFVAYLAAWVFMFPVMAVLCTVTGCARTWLEFRLAREAKRQARAAALRY